LSSLGRIKSTTVKITILTLYIAKTLSSYRFLISIDILAFQQEKKLAVIVSQKGSTGFSLHATGIDLADPNQRPRQRVHILLQMPWSPLQVQQQIGRTNRCGQEYAPIYVVVTTNVPGEQRFMLTILERLQKMV